MVTVHELVNNATFSAYDSADAINAIESAYYHLSALVDADTLISISAGVLGNTNLEITNNNEQNAIVNLAVALLIEARKHIKSKAQDITPKTIDELVTDDMRDMLLVGDPTDEDDVDEDVMWDDSLPSEHWDVS